MRIKDVVLLLTRTIVTQTLGLLRSFIIVPVLTISDFGLYRYIISVLGYANYFNFGTVALLGFKYPFYDAAGETELAQKLQYLVRTTVVFGFLIFLGSLIFFFGSIPRLDTTEKFLFAGVCSFLSIIPYFSMYYRTRFDYQNMVKREMLVAILSFVCFITLGFRWGLTGFVVGYASMGLISLVINWKTLTGVGPSCDWAFIKRNLNFSILLAVSGVINQLMVTGDLLLIKNIDVLPPDHFGVYAFCAMIATLVPSYMGALADVNTQELLRFLGTRDEKLADVEVEAVRTIERLEGLILRDFIVAIALAAAVFLVTNFAVSFFFPKYHFALEVLGPFMVGSVVLRWRTYPVVFMNHLQKTYLANISSFIAVSSMVVFIYLAMILEVASVYTLAWVSFVSYLICSIFSIASIFTHYNQSHRLPAFLKHLLLILLPSLLFASSYFIGASGLLGNILIVGVMWIAIFFVLRLFIPTTYDDLVKLINQIAIKISSSMRNIGRS